MGKVVEKERVGEKLPEGWKWVALGELCSGTGQYGISDKTASEPIGIPVLRMGNISNGQILWDDLKYIDTSLVDFEKYKLLEGDIVFNRTNSAELVGKTAVFDGSRPAILASYLIRFRTIKNIAEPYYVAAYINSSFGRKFIEKSMTRAVGQVNISASTMYAMPIPLPPLPEQKRIVGILSDRLSAIEQARAATAAQLAAAKALPAAYLRQVFDSPEAQKWPRKKLGDIALTVQNGIYKSSEYYGSGYPFLRMYNLKNSSWKLDFTTIAQVILDDDELRRFSLEIGDLLVSRVNSFELVGKCGWVDSEAKNYVFENMLIRVRLIDSVDSLFIAQQMGYRKIREQIQAVAKQAIGQASINSTDIRNIELQVPPLEKQKCVAMELSEKTQQSEKLQQSLQSQLDTINQLPAALLRQAFNGEL